jgi:hypothetical protein
MASLQRPNGAQIDDGIGETGFVQPGIGIAGHPGKRLANLQAVS